jgi:MFS family permease
MRVVLALCLAEVLTMIATFAFPAALPTFLAEWRLTSGEAGWIGGIFFLGYALAVPVLVSLTDRIDARRVYLGGAAVIAAAAAGFAGLAEGFWTAMLFRTLGGAGLAATYMPGLRALVDRYHGPRQAHAISFYTSSFSLGTGASFLVVGELTARFGWRPSFWLAAGCAAVGVAIVATLPPVRPTPAEQPTRLLDFRPVLRNRQAMVWVLGYTAHCWELFAARSWHVGFLAFVVAAHGGEPGGNGWLSPTTAASVGAVVAMAASIFGGDLALRVGRRRLVLTAMLASGLGSLVLGWMAALPYTLVALVSILHSALIQIDSAALTTGAVQSAEPSRRGATMALHSLLGFTAGALSPAITGLVLDAGGGGQSALAWGLAYGAVGLGGLAGVAMLMRGDREK